MAASTSVTLNNGVAHPLLGFGTYKVGFIPASAASGGSITRPATEIILDAITAGYRCFDCAAFYGNDADIGQALIASGIPRKEFFLISKVWTTAIFDGEAAIRAQISDICKKLCTDYLDVCLIHWPVPGKHVEAYQVLEKLVKEGVLRTIGLSNYTIEDYLELKPHVSIAPSINQIEISPWLFRKNTVSFFQKEGILLHSYRTLRQGKALEDPLVKDIAQRLGRTPSQVIGRWCVQSGFVFLPKTQSISRMQENAAVFNFELSGEDMEKLNGLTTPEAIAAYRTAYNTGIVRETPLQGKLDVSGRVVTQD